MSEEIQSLEIVYFVQATEDVERLDDAVMEKLKVSDAATLDELEGHFGNPIVRARHHLTGDEAMAVFRNLITLIGSEGVSELLRSLDLYLDEHKSLYVRLNKQELLRGIARLSSIDSVRIKVKPRGFMKGDVRKFYARMMETETS